MMIHFNKTLPYQHRRTILTPLLLSLSLMANLIPTIANDQLPPRPIPKTITDSANSVKVDFDRFGLCAGTLKYDSQTGLIEAFDDIKLIYDTRQTLTAPYIKYNTKTQSGQVRDFHWQLSDSKLRARGDQANLDGKTIKIKNASLTSCPRNDIDWQVRVGQAHSNFDDGFVSVEDAVLEIANLPVFYLPFARFYYNHQKHSGFLQPKASISSNRIKASAPYYLFLADNYDWTITPKWYSNHGLEVANEFRFLTSQSSGDINLGGIFFDDHWRHHQAVQYRWTLANSPWSLTIDAENVSDKLYLRNFGNDFRERAKRHLSRRAQLTYQTNQWQVKAAVENFQTLGDDLASPYSATPQIDVTHIGEGGGFVWQNYWQYALFRHKNPDAQRGNRVFWLGQLNRPFYFDKVVVIPEVGIHASKYLTDNQDNGSFTVPYTSWQINSSWFDNNIGWLDLENQAYHASYRLRTAWVYAADRNQDFAPLYDSELKQNSLENIYQWNRFVGGDRASDGNFIAYGAEYRLVDEKKNNEVAFFGLAQRYYLKPSKPLIHDETAIQKGLGNALMAMRLDWDDWWSVSSDGEWNFHNHNTERFYFDTRVHFDSQHLLKVGYLQEQAEILFLGGAASLNDYVDIAITGDYSLNEDRFTTSQLALRVRDSCDCWRFSLKLADSTANETDGKLNFTVGLELSELGSVGNNYNRFVEDNIR